MAQESISNLGIAIIGAGPAGCICAKYLKDANCDVTLFDKGKFLRTILPTGGGRCNLAYSEFDFRQLVKNYPRGEKFLYSLFSRFSTQDTINLMETLGIQTYTQEDKRIFPTSNSAKNVREKILTDLKSIHFVQELVQDIEALDCGYKITTTKATYSFDIVVIAIGGHSGIQCLDKLNINIIPQVKSLVGLKTSEKFSDISGVSVKKCSINIGKDKIQGDLLFTHNGLSGPIIYKLSSIFARKKFPYTLKIRFVEDFDLQTQLNKNPHKEIKNLLSQYIPKSLVVYILKKLNISLDIPCHKINGELRNKICQQLFSFEVNFIDKFPDGEIVTCGGIDLKEVNPKTLELKKYNNLYCCGEILDIDGFCGGFNLQNCWTTGFIAANGILINNSNN